MRVIRNVPGIIIVEHKLGFICANAGIDHSNVSGPDGDPKDWVLFCLRIQMALPVGSEMHLQARYKVQLAVLIIDSHGRAWRNGIVGASIGMSGIPAIVDMRGKTGSF